MSCRVYMNKQYDAIDFQIVAKVDAFQERSGQIALCVTRALSNQPYGNTKPLSKWDSILQ
jgi:hypothetical protein